MSARSQEISDKNATFNHKVQEVIKAFTETDTNDTNPANPGVKSKEMKEVEVPVFHTFSIKAIEDGAAGPYINGTFVQWVFGVPSPEGSDPDKKPYFDYIFNDYAAMDGLVHRRKTEAYMIQVKTSDAPEKEENQALPNQAKAPLEKESVPSEGGSQGTLQKEGEWRDNVETPSTTDARKGEKKAEEEKISDTAEEDKQTQAEVWCHTFQIKAPLTLALEFDVFPYIAKRASLDVEMSSREDNGRGLRLRPSLLLHNDDRRQNVCIKVLQKQGWTGKQTVPSYAGTATAAKIMMDGLNGYALVSPFPRITYHYDKNEKYCPLFSVSFWLVEEKGGPKIVQVILPLLLICCMNTWNVLTALKGRDDPDESSAEKKAADGQYLGNAAVLVLTAVFLLEGTYVLLIFIALALSSIPPGLSGSAFPATGLVGMGLFWLSLFPSAIHWIRYKRFIRMIEKFEQDRCNAKKGGEHPFLTDINYKDWRAGKQTPRDCVSDGTTSVPFSTETMDKDFTFVGGIVKKSKEGRRNKAAEWNARENLGENASNPCVPVYLEDQKEDEDDVFDAGEYKVMRIGETYEVWY